MMMQRLVSIHDRQVDMVSGPMLKGLALLVTRFALAGVFWLSGRTKAEEGTWWSVHILWTGLAAIPISRGGGLWSLDAIIGRLRAR